MRLRHSPPPPPELSSGNDRKRALTPSFYFRATNPDATLRARANSAPSSLTERVTSSEPRPPKSKIPSTSSTPSRANPRRAVRRPSRPCRRARSRTLRSSSRSRGAGRTALSPGRRCSGFEAGPRSTAGALPAPAPVPEYQSHGDRHLRRSPGGQVVRDSRIGPRVRRDSQRLRRGRGRATRRAARRTGSLRAAGRQSRAAGAAAGREDVDPNGDRSSLVRADLAVVERGQQRLEASVESLALGSRSTPNPSNSRGMYPLPTPRFRRPLLRQSTIAYCSASSIGRWNGSTLTMAPRRMRLVRAAQAARSTGGAGQTPPGWKWCSATHRVESPPVSTASARRTTSANRSEPPGGTPWSPSTTVNALSFTHRETRRRVEGVSRGREPGPPKSMAHRPKG